MKQNQASIMLVMPGQIQVMIKINNFYSSQTIIYLHNAFPDKQRVINNRKERQKMTKSKSAVAWLKCYATSFEEKLPNTCQIHLPPCSTKLHVYETMVSESQVEFPEHISHSHVLRLWREEAPYIAIPKVYSIA